MINFDLPKNIDDYVHRIGRTARAGNEGKATAFFSSQDEALSGALVSLLQKSQQPVPPFLTESSSGFGGYNGGGGGYNDYQQQGY